MWSLRIARVNLQPEPGAGQYSDVLHDDLTVAENGPFMRSCLPIVTLFPIIVGTTLPCGLCLATCIVAPSWTLLLLPICMLFTSPACEQGCHMLMRMHAWQAAHAKLSEGLDDTGSRTCMESFSPRNTAPYHMEELLPSFTSPTTDAFGATNVKVPSCGRFPWKAWRVWCVGTAWGIMSKYAVCARIKTWGSRGMIHGMIDSGYVFPEDTLCVCTSLCFSKRNTFTMARHGQGTHAHLPPCTRICPAPLFLGYLKPAQPSSRRCPPPAAGPEQTSPLRAGPLTTAFHPLVRSSIPEFSQIAAATRLAVQTATHGQNCHVKHRSRRFQIWPPAQLPP